MIHIEFLSIDHHADTYTSTSATSTLIVFKRKKKKENNIFQEFFFQELIINDSIRLTLTKNRFPSFLIYYQISGRGIASNANLRGK